MTSLPDPMQPSPVDRDALVDALRSANTPTLTMLLFQLTGDDAWITPPYAPTRASGLDDHDRGGLTPERIEQVRAAAADAVVAWAAGKPVAVPTPDPALGLRLAQVCVGEPVPERYGEKVAAELEVLAGRAPARPVVPPNDLRVLVVGAGVSGLTMAMALRDAGVAVSVVERSEGPGGVWADNRYPGAGVDTPSYVYSSSAFPRNWTTHFGKRDEVIAYFEEMVDHFGLREDITFGVEAESAVWDEAARRWTVALRHADGRTEQRRVDAVVTAVGLLNRPVVPDIPGLASFAGPVFHSARWPADLDLRGRRVALVGSGASAMQIAPAVADDVAALTIFQRSPQWIAPNANYFAPVPDAVHWLIEHVPYYLYWYRFRLNWTFGDRNHASMQKDATWAHPDRSLNAVNDNHRAFFTKYIEGQLDGRDDLIAASVPTYPPFGKRMLLDNGWYRTLRRDHVTLVTEPIAEVTAGGVVDASGAFHEADVLVLCTGFDPQRPVHPMTVTGRGGLTLADAWAGNDARAYLGVAAPDFPNLFFLYGPNTNPGGGAVISVVEQQVGYVVGLIAKMVGSGVRGVAVRRHVHDAYNARVDAAHERMVWSHPGMTTYYRNAAGRVVVNMPWPLVEYWAMMREPDLADYESIVD